MQDKNHDMSMCHDPETSTHPQISTRSKVKPCVTMDTSYKAYTLRPGQNITFSNRVNMHSQMKTFSQRSVLADE